MSNKANFLDVLPRYVQNPAMFQSWESTMIVVYALLGQLQAELERADTEDGGAVEKLHHLKC